MAIQAELSVSVKVWQEKVMGIVLGTVCSRCCHVAGATGSGVGGCDDARCEHEHIPMPQAPGYSSLALLVIHLPISLSLSMLH